MIVQQLGDDMSKGEEMKMCMDILNEMLISLTRDNVVCEQRLYYIRAMFAFTN